MIRDDDTLHLAASFFPTIEVPLGGLRLAGGLTTPVLLVPPGWLPPAAALTARPTATEVPTALTASPLPASSYLRFWQCPGYGKSGKDTCVLDWFDGDLVGSRAKSKDEAVPPPEVLDPKSWLEGFESGWADARRWDQMSESLK